MLTYFLIFIAYAASVAYVAYLLHLWQDGSASLDRASATHEHMRFWNSRAGGAR